MRWTNAQRDNLRAGMRACLRQQSDAGHWPRYAAFLATSIWLFGQLPVANEAAAILVATPLLSLLACSVLVAGSGLAVALALVGLWQPGRSNAVFSLLAVAITAWPFM
jgi:hypothetical protein